jgi:hypothetical protein
MGTNADCALAGDYIGIVVRVDEGQALFGLDMAGMGIGIVKAFAMQHDMAAHSAHGLDLDVGCGARHHDCGLQAELARRQRDALRMIAGRGANDTPRALFGRERGHLVVGAAQLEGEDRLQILALEADAGAQPGGEPRHAVERALDRHVIDAGAEDLADVVVHRAIPSGLARR